MVLRISVMLILDSVGESPAGQGSPDVGVPVRAGEAKSLERVDLNTAGVEEIVRPPGMTTETVERTRGNYPYRNLDELVTKKIIGSKEFAKNREYIVIGSLKIMRS